MESCSCKYESRIKKKWIGNKIRENHQTNYSEGIFMNDYKVIFSLNGIDAIILQLKNPLSCIDWNYADPIVLSKENTLITLADGPIFFEILDLYNILQKALNNQLAINKAITSDIGYLYNEYHYSIANLSIKQLQNIDNWIGEDYLVWEADNDKVRYITWIYNQNKKIIFEVTPFYPYFYCNKTKEPNYISYKKWIKNYQPYLIASLSQETAKQWVYEIEYIVKTVENNIKQ